MSQRISFLLAALAVLAVLALTVTPAAAQQPEPTDPGAPSAQASAEKVDDDDLTRKERKRQAKEQRIAEYLRKKEEKRAQRERQAQGLDPKDARGLEREQLTRQEPPAAAAAVPPPTETVRQTPRPRRGRARSSLPRNLARAQDTVRGGSLADDPNVREYLDLIDRQAASPHQLAAFGNFLAQNGLPAVAIEYYNVALRLERNDPVLWLNAGTIHRQRNDVSSATEAYERVLTLDPTNARAHYNLGAIFDRQGKYEDAIEFYKAALSLDPTLGDPAYNPQAANNTRLLAVKLMLYEEQSGSLGLPLVDPLAAPADRDPSRRR